MKEVMVRRLQDLEQVDPRIHAARIAHTVGENKRLIILDEAQRRGIHVLNPGPKKEGTSAVTPPSEEEKKDTAKPESAKEESKPQVEGN
jgi:large subunit ribosomal protein L32e